MAHVGVDVTLCLNCGMALYGGRCLLVRGGQAGPGVPWRLVPTPRYVPGWVQWRDNRLRLSAACWPVGCRAGLLELVGHSRAG